MHIINEAKVDIPVFSTFLILVLPCEDQYRKKNYVKKCFISQFFIQT